MFELKSIYFNTAYIGPTPQLAKRKIQQRLELGMDPTNFEAEDWFEFADCVRHRIAALVGCSAPTIAISTSVSELVSHVANGLNLGPQDEIILMDGDYPSLVLPWMVLSEQRGFKLRFLPLADFLDPARFTKALTAKTKFAACSHVMFNTGIRLPIADLGATCRSHEVLFLSDVSQSFGGMVLAPDIVRNCDVLVGVAYKWLLGPYGSAWGYFSEAALEKVPRTHASWLNSLTSKTRENLLQYSTQTFPGARRFDRGQAPSFLITAGLEGALDLIAEQGLREIERKNRALTDYFLEHLPKSFTVVAPYDLRSNIVCLVPGQRNPTELKATLSQRGITVSLREGNLRFSFHFFNKMEEVDKVLQVLSDNP